MPLRITSPAFIEGSRIPKKYTCDGDNVAPPLEWTGLPEGSKSIAVICEDPDAPSGTFTHWVLYDVPASKHGLAEGAAIGKTGVNDFGQTGFGGPCPPRKDTAHHYHFHVYALDTDSLGADGLSKADARDAISGVDWVRVGGGLVCSGNDLDQFLFRRAKVRVPVESAWRRDACAIWRRRIRLGTVAPAL